MADRAGSALDEAHDGLRRWLVEEAVPLWSDRGFDPVSGRFGVFSGANRREFEGRRLCPKMRACSVGLRPAYRGARHGLGGE